MKFAHIISNAKIFFLLFLQEVNFQFNEIRASGAIALAEAVSTLPRLDKLELGGNEIGETAIEVVREKLEGKEDVLLIR